MKLENPQQPATDAERVKLLAFRNKFYLITSIIFILMGLGLIIPHPHYPAIAHWTDMALAIGIPIAMVVFFVGAFRLAHYDLSPKDEFELAKTNEVQAKAYGILMYILLVLLVLHGYVEKISWTGLLLLLLGVMRFYEYYQISRQDK